jgi:hypothetical protein
MEYGKKTTNYSYNNATKVHSAEKVWDCLTNYYLKLTCYKQNTDIKMLGILVAYCYSQGGENYAYLRISMCRLRRP